MKYHVIRIREKPGDAREMKIAHRLPLSQANHLMRAKLKELIVKRLVDENGIDPEGFKIRFVLVAAP